jgi:hypothetical protein
VTHIMIRVDEAVPEQVLAAFPQLASMVQPPQTTLRGEVRDQQELQGVLNYLSLLGLTIVDVVTIPE